jgi:hypothetical protein
VAHAHELVPLCLYVGLFLGFASALIMHFSAAMYALLSSNDTSCLQREAISFLKLRMFKIHMGVIVYHETHLVGFV